MLDENTMYTSLANDCDMKEIYDFIFSYLSKDWKRVEIDFPFEEDFNKFSNDNYIVTNYANKNGQHCTVYLNPRTIHKYNYLLEK